MSDLRLIFPVGSTEVKACVCSALQNLNKFVAKTLRLAYTVRKHIAEPTTFIEQSREINKWLRKRVCFILPFGASSQCFPVVLQFGS